MLNQRYNETMNQKGFINIFMAIMVLAVVGVFGYYVVSRKSIKSPPAMLDNGQEVGTSNVNTLPSQPQSNSKEDISSCVSASDYTYTFSIVFSANTSKQVAEQILKDNNVESFRDLSSPVGYSFELPNNAICASVEGIFKIKDTFKIPVLYREPEEGQPRSGPRDGDPSCQNVPSYFVTSNSASPSNNFFLAYYQNGDQFKKALENVGAYSIVPIGGEKNYYATFHNGEICKSVQTLKGNLNVEKIQSLPHTTDLPRK